MHKNLHDLCAKTCMNVYSSVHKFAPGGLKGSMALNFAGNPSFPAIALENLDKIAILTRCSGLLNQKFLVKPPIGLVGRPLGF